MTLDDIRARIERIKAQRGDPEMMHALEDILHTDVLQAIERGEAGPEHAALALTTLNLDFARWCA